MNRFEPLYSTCALIMQSILDGWNWLWLNAPDYLQAVISPLLEFAFYYPLFMAYLWMIGAIIYYYHWEKDSQFDPANPPELPGYPPISILVPCHNEGRDAEETIHFLLGQQYPDFEIIAINDGSTDNTLEILLGIAQKHERVRVINLKENQGKAIAMKAGALFSGNEYLVCIDGDALLAPYASTWIMHHLLSGPRVGAVTGNPRIRTRSTLLGKIQVGEFSAIIGLIKRAQRVYGRLFTVSGVVAGFRKSALHRVGYWSNDMVTDDIDISWKLQLDHWDIRFEPNALCWILMPETLRGLWRQRLRWAQGGAEVLFRFIKHLGLWRSRRMWGVFIEYITSLLWSYTMITIMLLWVLGWFVDLPEDLQITSLIPSWSGVLLGMTCLLQFALSLIIDSRYEKDIGKIYYWMVWYPILYWLINVLTTAVGFIKAILKKRHARAVWISPDRGLR